MYLLLKADEDQRPHILLDADVIDLLSNPEESYGVTDFRDLDFLLKNPDPNYWPDGIGVLIKFDGVTIPKAVVSKHWVLDG